MYWFDVGGWIRWGREPRVKNGLLDMFSLIIADTILGLDDAEVEVFEDTACLCSDFHIFVEVIAKGDEKGSVGESTKEVVRASADDKDITIVIVKEVKSVVHGEALAAKGEEDFMEEKVPEAANVFLTLNTIEGLDKVFTRCRVFDLALWESEFEPFHNERWRVKKDAAGLDHESVLEGINNIQEAKFKPKVSSKGKDTSD